MVACSWLFYTKLTTMHGHLNIKTYTCPTGKNALHLQEYNANITESSLVFFCLKTTRYGP